MVAVLQLTEIEWLLCEVILALLVVLRPLVSTEQIYAIAAYELDISKSLRDYDWTKKFSVSGSKKMGESLDHIRLLADLSSKPPNSVWSTGKSELLSCILDRVTGTKFSQLKVKGTVFAKIQLTRHTDVHDVPYAEHMESLIGRNGELEEWSR